MKRILVSAAIAMAGLTVAPSMAQAGTISCGTAQRVLEMYNVTSCVFGDAANPDAALVGLKLGGTWTAGGGLTDADGTNGMLTVDVTNGSWGPDADGTFTINPTFWQTYGRGAISVHVGQGNNAAPDWWIFELVGGFTGTGTFDLDKLSGNGGGFSNMKLWGTGEPELNQLCDTSAPCIPNPEPASLLLMGTGLVGFAAMLRRKSRRA